MLILTRRVGETVVIGNDVTVTVLGVKGNQVRIGVNAPRDVAVHREEIFERIKREHEQGGGGDSQRPRVRRGSRAETLPHPRAHAAQGFVQLGRVGAAALGEVRAAAALAADLLGDV